MRRLYLLLSVTITVTAVLGVVFEASAIEQVKRPKRGEVVFGTLQRPIKENSIEIESFRMVFAQIAQKIVPAVVSVIPTKIDTVLFFKNPFRKFLDDDTTLEVPLPEFNKDKDGDPPVVKRERRRQGLGSGVIVSKSGYILTNFHVISGASEIGVVLSDNRTFIAKVVGADSLCDIAVVQITGKVPDDLPVAYMGNSDSLLPGEWVAAIGNPFSLTSTITAGIVSAVKRQVGDLSMYQNFIQTDAAINPGNSGGALVNVYGELVGINSLIYSRTGGYMGIGFAIPINMARAAMEDLIYEGKVTRGWIGVGVQEIGPTVRKALGLTGSEGVLITDVFHGQPAEKAGVKQGDIILSINDQKIENTNDLRNIVAMFRPGAVVEVVILRKNKKTTVPLTISQRMSELMVRAESIPQNPAVPEPAQKSELYTLIGIDVADLTKTNMSRYKVPNQSKGVVVTAVGQFIDDPREELKTGDLIFQAKVEGKDFVEINSSKELISFIKSLKEGQAVLLLAEHNTESFFVAFTMKSVQ